MTSISAEELAELRARLADFATSLPLRINHIGHMQHDMHSADIDIGDDRIGSVDYAAAGELIVAAVNALPRLLDRIQVASKRIASLESERATNHTRLAANDVRAAEQARRIAELTSHLGFFKHQCDVYRARIDQLETALLPR